MPRSKKTPQPETVIDERFREQKIEITGVLLLGMALLALLAFFFNGAGFIGEVLKEGLYVLFGKRGAVIPVVFIGVYGGLLLGHRKIKFLSRRSFSLIILFLCSLMLIHIFSGVSLAKEAWDTASGGGGVVGHFLVVNLLTWFGNIGIAIFLVICLVIAFILALERPLVEVVRNCLKGTKKAEDLPPETGGDY